MPTPWNRLFCDMLPAAQKPQQKKGTTGMDSSTSSTGASARRRTRPDTDASDSAPLRHTDDGPDAPASSDAAEATVSIGSFQRSQTRRHGRPENIGALSENPRVERQMQQLCNELESNTRKIVSLSNLANRPEGKGNGARIAALRLRQRQLTIQLKDCMRMLDPNLSGTVMERAKSPATADLEQTAFRVWEDYQRTQKASWSKYLWTILSGGIAYGIPFGTGTMLARGLERPYLVLLAGPLHTLAEPLWSMVRATTWTNPASEAYTGRQRARARANGDAWRYLANVPPKTKMLWIDPVSGKRVLLTAAQALATNQELWLWLHKMVSDDLPFFIFSMLYSAKNVLGDIYGPALFDRTTPEGMRNDLLAQFSDGFICGATSMLLGQLIRRLIATSTGGVQVVTKRVHDWHLQATYLKSYAEDIKDMLATGSVPEDDARLLRAKLREVETELVKASAKSTLAGSIGYEYSVMFQAKRLASNTDPDTPGKRLDTFCNMLGKTTTLLPSLGATYLCQPFGKSPDRMTRMIAHLVVPFSLVTWPGFAMRTELQDWYRSLFGACKGVASAMRAGCCCNGDDADDDAGFASDDSDGEEAPGMPADSDAGSGRAVDIEPDGGASAPNGTNSDGDSDDDGDGDGDGVLWLAADAPRAES
ncbi:hypothetical protein SAMN06295970_11365 [Noviherbaspirillum suwonense]|uniref:Uncharacterized protein n=2 Tax=Noviherbaspirillum suwonense TaxID=1224511 RepID=A0ABY1QGS2_9BURK|nr:hypothetical protein SAMN06295970_11365 [Noviherbaspirillum suwonense]